MAIPGESEFIARAAIATGLGAAIGFERALRDKATGLRTLSLVALGSCAFTVAGYGFLTVPDAQTVHPDPGRIAAQIVTGIGFLGAGVIFVAGGSRVRGLTSAADIWVVAAIGILCGVGLFLTAVAITGLALAVVILLRPLAFLLKEEDTPQSALTPAVGDGTTDDGSERANASREHSASPDAEGQ